MIGFLRFKLDGVSSLRYIYNRGIGGASLHRSVSGLTPNGSIHTFHQGNIFEQIDFSCYNAFSWWIPRSLSVLRKFR